MTGCCPKPCWEVCHSWYMHHVTFLKAEKYIWPQGHTWVCTHKHPLTQTHVRAHAATRVHTLKRIPAHRRSSEHPQSRRHKHSHLNQTHTDHSICQATLFPWAQRQPVSPTASPSRGAEGCSPWGLCSWAMVAMKGLWATWLCTEGMSGCW